jgi:DNA (cytosine-5)-methyltransferase 1
VSGEARQRKRCRVFSGDAMQITFGSLFAGIGGFDLGFERAGMICQWQVEIDDYATRVLAKHWPHIHRERDIRQCGRHNLQPVDVICGGFPCQDISYAGLGAGLEGERSGLFFEAVRVVRELQPRIVVLENVAALLTRGLDTVLGTLAAIGYDAEWDVIPACSVGADHIRERVFVLAYTEHSGMAWRRGTDSVGPSMFYGAGICEFESSGGRFKTDASLAKFAKDQTKLNREPSVHRVADGVSARMDRLRGLGNAVVPQVAEWIGRRVVEQLKSK